MGQIWSSRQGGGRRSFFLMHSHLSSRPFEFNWCQSDRSFPQHFFIFPKVMKDCCRGGTNSWGADCCKQCGRVEINAEIFCAICGGTLALKFPFCVWALQFESNGPLLPRQDFFLFFWQFPLGWNSWAQPRNPNENREHKKSCKGPKLCRDWLWRRFFGFRRHLISEKKRKRSWWLRLKFCSNLRSGIIKMFCSLWCSWEIYFKKGGGFV